MPSYYRQTAANRKSFGLFMRSDQMRKPVALVTAKIAERAREIAPKRTGNMAAGYTQRNAGTMRINGNRRVREQIRNSRRGALETEFGNARTPKSRTLGHAGSAYGKLRKGRKG